MKPVKEKLTFLKRFEAVFFETLFNFHLRYNAFVGILS